MKMPYRYGVIIAQILQKLEMDKYTTDLRLDEINVTGGDHFIEN